MKKNNTKYNKFVCEFYRELDKNKLINSNIIVLCIGTDKIIGDCFGPLVGDKLKEYNIKNFEVYGTLEKPICSLNLNDKINEINIKFKEPYIIAIDAALSSKENIGKIIVSSSFLQAGSGIKKNNIRVGNISIRAIVGQKESTVEKNIEILQNTSLNMVMNLAEIVSNGLIEVIQEC